jgi:hypothetical protein
MRHGERAEAEALGYLRSLGYWAERGGQGIYSAHVREQLAGTRSPLRWWVDCACGVPGRPRSMRLVDVKSAMPWRVDQPDIAVEVAPLMLAISGMLPHPTMFMVGRSWAFATAVHAHIRLDTHGHCCREHLDLAAHARVDDVAGCLAVIEALPEKCRPTRGSGDPYVWVAASCLMPVPRVGP